MQRAGDLDSDRADSASAIDYLSKDFGSFRRLMLDRLQGVAPGVATGQPADFGTAIVELLAYAAEQASYYQDAVGTEAYLGTARLRTSVRRHARLLDYPMHDGCNARAFVAIVVSSAAEGSVLPAGTALITRTPGQPALIGESDIAPTRSAGALVFETLHDLLLRAGHSSMQLSPSGGSLAVGATSALLCNDAQNLALSAGDVLIFEVLPPGQNSPSDPTLRHAVRLTAAVPTPDAQSGRPVVRITWDGADALPLPLDPQSTRVTGNIVLADHGYTLPDALALNLDETRATLRGAGFGRPLLADGPLTFRTRVLAGGGTLPFDPDAPASAAFPQALDAGTVVEPAITLQDATFRSYSARPDLLGSGPHAADFVVETEDDGRTYLRFGDGTYGRRPDGALYASYRVGNGAAGNVGAEALYHIVSDLPGLLYARNPLPATGGTDPEPIETVRLRAPQQFRQLQRAVTVDDYVTLAKGFSGVREALCFRRLTGNFCTIFLRVLRSGGLPVDAEFKTQLGAYLEPFRMAGQALKIDGPVEVPLNIALNIQPAPGFVASVVRDDVRGALGPQVINGQPGLCHPDRFTFGMTLYASQFVSAAMQVKGVAAAPVTLFTSFGSSIPVMSSIALGRFEVPVVRNLLNRPDQGSLVVLVGGLR